ncbi:hypothetical protein [Tautonia marina]|uniref:hypothetical protein n=1 Tax=Tautonia marina TaxID=2653855 RepID=UPI0013760AB3|nr:hypothetical protein [Tautonia marina]
MRSKPEEPADDAERTGLPIQPVDTYTDELGRKITIYPTRYAEGSGVQPFTAKPRRRE